MKWDSILSVLLLFYFYFGAVLATKSQDNEKVITDQNTIIFHMENLNLELTQEIKDAGKKQELMKMQALGLIDIMQGWTNIYSLTDFNQNFTLQNTEKINMQLEELLKIEENKYNVQEIKYDVIEDYERISNQILELEDRMKECTDIHSLTDLNSDFTLQNTEKRQMELLEILITEENNRDAINIKYHDLTKLARTTAKDNFKKLCNRFKELVNTIHVVTIANVENEKVINNQYETIINLEKFMMEKVQIIDELTIKIAEYESEKNITQKKLTELKKEKHEKTEENFQLQENVEYQKSKIQELENKYRESVLKKIKLEGKNELLQTTINKQTEELKHCADVENKISEYDTMLEKLSDLQTHKIPQLEKKITQCETAKEAIEIYHAKEVQIKNEEIDRLKPIVKDMNIKMNEIKPMLETKRKQLGNVSEIVEVYHDNADIEVIRSSSSCTTYYDIWKKSMTNWDEAEMIDPKIANKCFQEVFAQTKYNAEKNVKSEVLGLGMKNIEIILLVSCSVLFGLAAGIIVYFIWKNNKQSNKKDEFDHEFKPSPTLSDILKNPDIVHERSYESSSMPLRSNPNLKLDFKSEYTTTTTTYFCANQTFMYQQEKEMQMLSPSHSRPALSLQGIEYKPNTSNTSKFCSTLEPIFENENLEREFSLENEDLEREFSFENEEENQNNKEKSFEKKEIIIYSKENISMDNQLC